MVVSSVDCYIQVGCVCNNAQLRGGQIIGHPTEGAMLALAHKLNLFGLRDQFVRTEERTFSSEKKWMGVLVRPRSHQVTEVSSSLSSSSSLQTSTKFIHMLWSTKFIHMLWHLVYVSDFSLVDCDCGLSHHTPL